MTLVALPSRLIYPGLSNGGWLGAAAATAGSTLDAAGEYQGMVFQAQEDMVISHIAWRPHAVTGSPTADVRIETLGATGFGSGTLWATNTNIVTGVLTAAARVDALTAAATITKGQFFAVIIQYNSGTSLQVRRQNTTNSWSQALPYGVVNVGTPTKQNVGSLVMALGSSATTFYSHPRILQAAPAAATFNNTNSAARGNKFTLPFACRISGIAVCMGANAGDFNIGLWDAANNELGSTITAVDGDYNQGGAGLVRFMTFDNAYEAAAGDTLIAAIEPSTSTNVDENTIDLPTADYRSAMPGGTNCFRATRASGTWSDDTDSVGLLDLLIDQLSDDAGSGGGGGISRARGFGGFA